MLALRREKDRINFLEPFEGGEQAGLDAGQAARVGALELIDDVNIAVRMVVMVIVSGMVVTVIA